MSSSSRSPLGLTDDQLDAQRVRPLPVGELACPHCRCYPSACRCHELGEAQARIAAIVRESQR